MSEMESGEEALVVGYGQLAARIASLHEQFNRLKASHHALLESNGLLITSDRSLVAVANNLATVTGGAAFASPMIGSAAQPL